MTFTSALSWCRPMRRKHWKAWVYLGKSSDATLDDPEWHWIETGRRMHPSWGDYMANDWEVM